MRVGLIAEQRLAPVPGGTGRYAGEVGASLVATAAPGDQVSIWTAWHRDATAARVTGASGPHRLPLPRRALTLAWEHRRGPAPAGVDVVHATTPLLPPKRRSALVVTIHDTVPWSHPETLTPRGVSWHRRMAAVAAREADAVVVPSNAMGEELDRLLGLGDRLRVIGLGVGADIGLPADAAARAERMRLPVGGYWLALATVEPRKGLDVLIAALAEPGAPPLPLLVAGPRGWGGVDVDGLAARHGVAPDRVRALGRVDDADRAVLLHRATALVAPSRAEGFGLPVLEAMASGTPVVSSDAPALAEVGGGATYVVRRDDPPALAQALAEVAADAGLRERLASGGRQRSRAYSWTESARALWRLYADLC